MIRVIIVDDESLARDNIRLALEKEDDIEIAAECRSGREAVQAIGARDPDLVFLDVEMPTLNGFQIIEEVGADKMPGVVFVTAFDEHAVQAFSVHAFDYVLKPFTDERFAEAVEHARRRLELGGGRLGDRYKSLLRDVSEADGEGTPLSAEDHPATKYISRILVKEKETARFVEVTDVEWIGAAGNYVRLHMLDGATHLVRSSVSALEDRLDPTLFVRVHRSTILNLDRVEEIQPWAAGDHIAILRSGQQLRVSRTFRRHLLRPMF